MLEAGTSAPKTAWSEGRASVARRLWALRQAHFTAPEVMPRISWRLKTR